MLFWLVWFLIQWFVQDRHFRLLHFIASSCLNCYSFLSKTAHHNATRVTSVSYSDQWNDLCLTFDQNISRTPQIKIFLAKLCGLFPKMILLFTFFSAHYGFLIEQHHPLTRRLTCAVSVGSVFHSVGDLSSTAHCTSDK